MGSSKDELELFERVFLRLGSTETDQQLESVLGKFLTPVLLKLASPHEQVRKKVMELLIHINKRLKTRPLVQLPVEALLTQYHDPKATSFVINFSIIYIKTGFPRLPVEKQVELVPAVLNALKDKPQTHVDSLLFLLLPLLDKVKVPTDPKQTPSVFGLDEKQELSKHLLGFLLDVLLLPYGAVGPKTESQSENNSPSLTIPPAMSEYSFKRVTTENPMKPDELEEVKLGIVKFLAHGIFKNEDIILHFIVASSDTRFSVANLAETEVRKIIGTIDWSSSSVCLPIYIMYLGSQGNVRQDQKKSPASIRIRLKLLQYLCRAKDNGLIFPMCIQVVFDSLYGNNTNTKLKGLALNFTNNIIRSGNMSTLKKLASVLLGGLQKYTNEGEENQKGQAYVLIGLLAQKFPDLVYHNLTLFEHFLHNLEEASADLKLQIREGLLSFIIAFKYDSNPDEADKDGRLNLIYALVKNRCNSEDVLVRFVTVKVLACVFPPDHVPSKLLLLQACGDMKDEVSSEAYKSLYGQSRKADINLSNLSDKHVTLPSFTAIIKYIENEDKSQRKQTSGNELLPYTVDVCKEVLIYVRLCLIQDAKVPLVREIMNHPCDDTPIIAEHLRKIYSEPAQEDFEAFNNYLKLCRQLLISNSAIEALACLVEAIGCLPQYSSVLSEDTNWINDQLLSSVKTEVREYASVLYGLLLMNVEQKKFEEAIQCLIKQCNHKTLEVQHGALLALGTCLESRLRSKTGKMDSLVSNVIYILNDFLKNSNPLLSGAACSSIGIIASCASLPIDNGKINESPNAKKPATEAITKVDLFGNLLNIMNNKKLNTKLKEKAARSLGLLCVGERFPHVRHVLEGLLDTAKETKDVEVHLTIGESLVMCVQTVYSPEARNKWFDRITEYNPEENDELPDENLDWLLGQLLKLSENTNPNSRQASSIWLLAVVKSCGKREPISNRLDTLQNTFLGLLGENNDIVQDVAAKALCVFYDTYKSEELLSALVRQLTTGARQVQQVSSDTKLFEAGQLGASPTGGNLTTYKELCSLASDLNKPDLIYQFMHLANHNAMWNSKKGAAFGFSTIAKKCGEELKNYLPVIVPKLYRYQYDPSPNIQNSMHNIWRVLVSEQQKVVEQYFHEILKDLIENLNSGQYRVRQSCCLAIQDLLRSSGNKSVHDAVNNMGELWTKLFRVMDDHHEETRTVATNTAKVLSKLCVQACGEAQGKDGIKMMEAILPPLLDDGIMSSVAEIRLVSLQAISQLVDLCGKQIKLFLPTIIPALLKATGDLESSKLSYLSTRLGGTQSQEIVDDARASMAKSYFTTETVSNSLQYVDNSILEQLIPKIIDLMKQSVGLATRIACTHCITLLIVQMDDAMQPYSKKLISVLTRGLRDRNAAIRKNYAMTIGYVASVAKDSTVEKLIEDLDQWYIEGKDASVKTAVAYAIQSISVQSQKTMKKFSSVLLPLIFFAMHDEKTPDTMSTLQIWEDLWSDNTVGTESGIKQYLQNHISTIKLALEMSYWSTKAQAANAITTLANKIGSNLDMNNLTSLIDILLNNLKGRTWNGKEKLLKALASICTNCKDSINSSEDLKKQIAECMLQQCQKDNIPYKIEALKSLGDILSSLELDKFEEVYGIVKNILIENGDGKDKDEEDLSVEEIAKNREDNIQLKCASYVTLGKSWIPTTKGTQEKFREIFVRHCMEFLPKITRTIQMSVLEAMYNFVQNLKLLEDKDLSEADERSLTCIVDQTVLMLGYSLAIPKYTRLRKESLNIVTCLVKKLSKHREYMKVAHLFGSALPELEVDSSPEIKTRIRDIKLIISGKHFEKNNC
ncbi:proteasome adapter and scaffold protein ECM29 [Coccinella septempunctata]|uniref:proteasome adapter and scaffold protein ECM29 n=1 Tax=Coccinella septempunctata TaxID=41139 RepID=UPI001D093B03|nr:proteasome adapter and scaffold protein ECM29 [Coccinella septempunctata]